MLANYKLVEIEVILSHIKYQREKCTSKRISIYHIRPMLDFIIIRSLLLRLRTIIVLAVVVFVASKAHSCPSSAEMSYYLL
jgi:hypothetical protein